MKFSIIIPAYNAGDTILNTLYSIQTQSFDDFEIIIINDGSTDNTENVAMNFFTKNNITNYKYFKTNNKGVSSARNIGWNNSIGEYICFLDSDDIWHKDKLKIINQVILKYNCDFIGHLYQVNKLTQTYDINENPYKLNIMKYLIRNLFQTSCVCLRRNIPMRFDESMSYSEDYDLFLRIVKSYNCYKIDCVLTTLGRPPLSKGGLSYNRIQMRRGEIRAYIKFCFAYKWFIFLLPFLMIWSLIKYLRSTLSLLLKQ
jgi:glycosyltransferase involved in cell wall biosynthesis